MRWTQKLSENIKKGIRSWLNVTPAGSYGIQINEIMDFELHAIRNRIWYRGDGNELEQMYSQTAEYADKYKFWASKCSKGMEMRKIHTGLPGLMVKSLTSIVMTGMNDFEFKDALQKALWDEIDKENDFKKLVKESITDMLVVGDGAFKIIIDTSVSPHPILEWYPGERIEIVRKYGRLEEVVFKSRHKEGSNIYVLHEHYGHGYIIYKLYKDEEMVDMSAVEKFQNLHDVKFDNNVMLAVPIKVYESTKYENRGGSIFDGKIDAFDAFDEVWSQWMDAVRAGRAKTYIPESYIPRDMDTGKPMSPNPFDNRFIAGDNDMSEGAKNTITTEQPDIPHDSYVASYCTALDICLQGVISPSTLGIDVKKLDNAEAQREKEKTTLYTRNAVIETLQKNLPKVVEACLNAEYMLNKQPVKNVDVFIDWGEYANPSFESQIETLSKARTGGVMSIDRVVNELYGDTIDESEKEKEIMRLKAEQGIEHIAEPDMSTKQGEFEVNES